MKFNAGFIYVAPNCDPKQQNAVIPGESIDLYVYGCSTYSQAEVVAKSLVEEKGCTAIELCALDHGGVESCDAGRNGIPSPTTTRYVSAMNVAKGIVTLTGQESLNGLTVTMTPQWNNGNGMTGWTRDCNISADSELKQACEDVFRFDNN